MKFFTYISPILYRDFYRSICYGMEFKRFSLSSRTLYNLSFWTLIKNCFWQLDGRRIGGRWSRTPHRINTPNMPGHTDNAIPDYCSFEGPYFNSSLNYCYSITKCYVPRIYVYVYVLAVGTNPYKPPGGIVFSILLGMIGIANLSYRYILMCDDFKAMAIGLYVVPY